MKITNLILSFSTILLLAACGNNEEAKKETESKKTTEAPQEISGTHSRIDPTNSEIHWKGTKKIGDFQEGTVNIKSGEIISNRSGVIGGSIEVDMTTIADIDSDPDLEGHLKSADFFDIAKFPTSTYKISKVSLLINNPQASHMIYGDMTIKGITKPVNFVASITKTDSGFNIKSSPIKIDRTLFNVQYNSTKFFDNLKDNIINDDIELTINIKS